MPNDQLRRLIAALAVHILNGFQNGSWPTGPVAHDPMMPMTFSSYHTLGFTPPMIPARGSERVVQFEDGTYGTPYDDYSQWAQEQSPVTHSAYRA